jgi:dethiobiotin synthetase
MHRYFVIGTDTDCGKTYITCELLKYFKQQNSSAIGLKPVASGCEVLEDGTLSNSDVRKINQINNIGLSEQDISPWNFEPAIAPHLAAQKVGVNINTDEIANFCLNPRWQEYDYTLIEGAGGLLVPLNANETWLDVLQKTKIPVILVVGMRLGCLNHALLTASVLQSHNITVVGWIANMIDPHMQEFDLNLNSLVDRLNCPLLGVVLHNDVLNIDAKFTLGN